MMAALQRHRREPPPRQAASLCPDHAGSAADKRPARGRSPRHLWTLQLPAPAVAGHGLQAEHRKRNEELPHLDKPFVPLAVALRSMLAETEGKLVVAALAEKARLQERAEVL